MVISKEYLIFPNPAQVIPVDTTAPQQGVAVNWRQSILSLGEGLPSALRSPTPSETKVNVSYTDKSVLNEKNKCYKLIQFSHPHKRDAA